MKELWVSLRSHSQNVSNKRLPVFRQVLCLCGLAQVESSSSCLPVCIAGVGLQLCPVCPLSECGNRVATVGKGHSVVISCASAAGVGRRGASVSPCAEPSWLVTGSGRYIEGQSDRSIESLVWHPSM